MASLLDHDFGSESEDDNFNPAPADESDNEAAGDSDPEVNINQTSIKRKSPAGSDDLPASPSKKAKGEETNGNDINGAGAEGGGEDDEDIDRSAHDDDDEDEEDEDSDEEAVSGRPRKRMRRNPRNQYLDVEAEVDEDEDEDNDEDDEGAGDPFVADIHPDDIDELPPGTEKDDRRHRELDRQRDQAIQMDAEKQAELLRVKYGRSARPGVSATTTTVPRRFMLPGVSDPSIWGVKCKPGKEKELVFAIMKRIEERANTNSPVPIISVFERAAMPGYLYIEARKQADVFAALDGVSNVYPRTKILLVPIKEMPDLLRVIKSKELRQGGYVRIKRGLYAGDLALIDDTESNGLEISLKLVPRLSYGMEEDKAPMVTGKINAADRKRKAGPNKSATRPPQRLFSEVEAKKKHARNLTAVVVTSEKKQFTYFNDTYINGFLQKDYKLQHVQTENVDPKLEEVTMFTSGGPDGTENLDLAALAASLKNNTSNESYLPGDVVEVYDGEQQGVIGKAVTVRADIVTLTVTEGELRGQRIEVPVKGLRKRFKEGDHVKVIGASRYRDEVGMVVRINADTVTIMSDLSMQEITVFSKDLREASDSGTAGGLGQYALHDLVQLDQATVAIVTKVDRESLRVLDQDGSIRSVMPSQISNQLERRRHAVATDRNGSEIRNDDTVKEVGGERKQGVIMHIYRSFLFVWNREQVENAGASVLRANNVETVAAKGGRIAQTSSGPDLTKMNPALQRNGMNGTNGMPPPKTVGRDRALGQTVTIRKGVYKGLLGIVKDTTDTEARVELHTKSKTITVNKETLGFKDPITGQSIDYSRFSGSRGRGGSRGGFAGAGTSSRIPDGGRTPSGIPQGGRTPAWGNASGGRTPAYGSSGRTPAWHSSGMSGSRTPAYAGGGGATVNPYADGSRTAYGGFAGARTPAWDPSSRTSYGGSTTNDPFSSSRTPAYEPSSRTPAYSNDAYSSFNPSSSNAAPNDPRNNRAAYDAPTPAAAPTPSASTNGGGYSVSTPAAAAATPYGGEVETPYSGQPETPGWGAGDADGPRYEEGTPSP